MKNHFFKVLCFSECSAVYRFDAFWNNKLLSCLITGIFYEICHLFILKAAVFRFIVSRVLINNDFL